MKDVDCLILGYHNSGFEEHESIVGRMGKNSHAYHDLQRSFVSYNKFKYPVIDFINFVEGKDLDSFEPLQLSIMYLHSYLTKHNLSSEYINALNHKTIEGFKTLLSSGQVKSLAITTTLYVHYFSITNLIELIRSVNKDINIIIGGPFINTFIRNHGIDSLDNVFAHHEKLYFIDNTQGEKALEKLLKTLKSGGDLRKVENIVHKHEGKLIQNYKVNENVFFQSRVNWRLFKNEIKELAFYRSAKSCPFSCSFCGFPEHAGKYQYLEVDEINKELIDLGTIKKNKHFFIVDDTFNVPLERFKKILRGFIDYNYGFKWASYLRCQFLDEETVKLMKESGCELVYLGIESANDEMLQNMNKKVTKQQYIRGVELLKKYDIPTLASFIAGFPGETKESYMETHNFIEEMQFDFYRMQLWFYDTITPISKEKEKYNLKGSSFEWSHNTMDSDTANELVNFSLKNIKNSVFCPQHNFDHTGLVYLLSKGYSLNQIKVILSYFQEGLKYSVDYMDVPDDILLGLSQFCRQNEYSSKDLELKNNLNLEVGFNF